MPIQLYFYFFPTGLQRYFEKSKLLFIGSTTDIDFRFRVLKKYLLERKKRA